MTPNDWIDDVIQEIEDARSYSRSTIREAIEKHCPFKVGVVYVAVVPNVKENDPSSPSGNPT